MTISKLFAFVISCLLIMVGTVIPITLFPGAFAKSTPERWSVVIMAKAHVIQFNLDSFHKDGEVRSVLVREDYIDDDGSIEVAMSTIAVDCTTKLTSAGDITVYNSILEPKQTFPAIKGAHEPKAVAELAVVGIMCNGGRIDMPNEEDSAPDKREPSEGLVI